MKYYLIAGEASGDLHGSNLVRELRLLQPAAELRGWGGDAMAAAGVDIQKHYRDLAFMGFAEVVANLPTILRNFRLCKSDILAYQPDAIVLIDYPGFNLRIAEWAKEAGFKVIYYISPQVWAWKENRVKKIKKVVDKMIVILPFEEAFYRDKWDYKVAYVGHPLVRIIEEKKRALASTGTLLPGDKPYLLLLPGSRKQEIRTKLPIMLAAAQRFPDHRIAIGMAPSIERSFYESIDAEIWGKVQGFVGETYALMHGAAAALVTSGTATLETALFGAPQVVCYKGSPISYAIAKRLLHIKYISLVNLIMDKPVVKELIQGELTPDNIERELKTLLHDKGHQKALAADYAALKALLQQGGDASAKAAALVVATASK